jgi:hypothetical protein
MLSSRLPMSSAGCFARGARRFGPRTWDSRQVIDALAAALQLTAPERDYLHALASGSTGQGAPQAAVEVLAPGVAELVAWLDPHPDQRRAPGGSATTWSRSAEDANGYATPSSARSSFSMSFSRSRCFGTFPTADLTAAASLSPAHRPWSST